MKKTLSKTKIVALEAQSLRIHPDAQRDIVPAKLKKLKAEMDLDAIGVLHAVEYNLNGDSGVWVIDGQHRLRALMDLGLGEWLVEVKIHLDVADDARASELFLKLNDRAIVSPFAKFTQGVKAGYPIETGIVNIISQRGLKVADSTGDSILACPASLRRVYSFDNGKALKQAIDIILQSWGTRAAALEGRLIEGVGLLCKTYSNKIDQPALIKKLAKYPGGPSAVIGHARGLREHRKASIARCIAEIIIDTYNKGRKKRLDLI